MVGDFTYKMKSHLLESLYEVLTELCLYMRCPSITKILAISLHRVTSLMNGPLLTRPKCHQGQCENLSRLSARSSGNTFAPLGTSCHRRSWSIRFASPSSVVAKLCRPNQSDEQCEEPQPTKTKVVIVKVKPRLIQNRNKMVLKHEIIF